MSREPWFDAQERFVNTALNGAREYERKARELRKLAAQVTNPPEGMRVEVHPSGLHVSFVTPLTEAADSQASAAHEQAGT